MVCQHTAGHAHREHPVGKDRWITGDLRRINLIRVQRVVVTRCAGVLHDLGSFQIFD